MTEPSNSRFTAQSHIAEDLLKEQTLGLVHLSDFRKRRAEAEEAAAGQDSGSGTSTPDGREHVAFKSKRKKLATGAKKSKKGALSFGHDDDDENDRDNDTSTELEAKASTAAASRSVTPGQQLQQDTSTPMTDSEQPTFTKKKRLVPSNSVAFVPKAQTKASLQREAQLKEALRKEYALVQEAVRQTEFMLPFTFFDGKSMPGGACRMKKGDPTWLFLERARKVGAAGGDKSRKDWARIGVDDLMVVRGEVIIPHHYDFHYFLLNRSVGYTGQPLFSYSAETTAATPERLLPHNVNNPEFVSDTVPLSTAASRSQQAQPDHAPESLLEGVSDDPSLTKVVDRRWYERHKHIYPASIWEDFDPEKDYSKGARKDGEGNAFFFSATKK